MRASKAARLSLWLPCQAAVHQRKRSEQKKMIPEDPWSHLCNLQPCIARDKSDKGGSPGCQVKDAAWTSSLDSVQNFAV
jgi:hypothetical protein